MDIGVAAKADGIYGYSDFLGIKTKNSTVLQYFKEEYGTKLVDNEDFDNVESVSYSDNYGIMLAIRKDKPLLVKGSSLQQG